MVGIDLLINIAASIIYDVAKKTCLLVIHEEKHIKIQINKYIKENISGEFNELIEISGIEGFFTLPQVADIINSYIVYVINGNISEKLVDINKQKQASLKFINEDDVIRYLTNSFISYNSKSIISHNSVIMDRFIKHVFKLAKDYFLLYLDTKSKVEVFEVNQRIIQGFNLVIEKLEKYTTNIENIIKQPVLMRNFEFDKLRTEYMGILKKKHNKALIYLLDDFDLDKFYIPPTLSTGSPRSFMHVQMRMERNFIIHPIPYSRWEYIFSQDNIVYITGGAGYGKSLLMKNIIINHGRLNIVSSSEHIVIYGEIKWFIKKDGSFKSMTEFLSECITNSTLKRINDDFINYHLDTGRCILLLDALDEVPMDKRKDLHQTIIAHLKNLNPNNKVCLTSRDRGFIPVEEEIEHFNIEPLDADQIEQYVDKIIKLKKFNPQDKKPFMEQAKGLVEKRFLNSFLILSLLINIYKGERELPETKLELYQKCLEYISNKREKPKTDDNFDWKLITPLLKDNTFIELSLLCFPNNKEVKEDEVVVKLMQVYDETFVDTATLENAISEFLKFCSERTELFVPANIENSFKFFHRSFFEYFYSKHIVIRSKDNIDMYRRLSQFDVDSEIFELTLARLKQDTQDKYISIVKYVFEECEKDFSSKQPTFKAINILILFFQVTDEETFQNRLISLIVKNSQLIVSNIDKITNQEIILNIITRTNSVETVLVAFEQYAYKEMQLFIKLFDIEELKHILDRTMAQEDALTFFIERQMFRSSKQPLHFYSYAMLSQYDIMSIFKRMVSKSFIKKGKQLNKVNEIIHFYDALEKNYQESLDKVLLRYIF